MILYKLKLFYRMKWIEASKFYNFNGKKVSIIEKLKNEKRLKYSINKLINIFQNFPEGYKERVLWKDSFYSELKLFLFSIDLIKDNNISMEMLDKFLDVSKKFILYCFKFDRLLSLENIGQALRNQWIISFLQIAMNVDIGLTKATFAYSLLYPYTDNYLDDVNISLEEKEDFNKYFEMRLMGSFNEPRNFRENKIWNLVYLIEEDFPREEYPDVYKSLLYIHNGQIKSLFQHDEKIDEDMILDISLEKGGSSVLADGYLINGNLSKEEERFMFGYGFILQLADDLDDLNEDMMNYHMTVPSYQYKKYPLDDIANKIFNLTANILSENIDLLKDKELNFINLLEGGINNLVLKAIVSNYKAYSKEYIKSIKAIYPFRLRYVRLLQQDLCYKFEKVKRKFNEDEIRNIIEYLLIDDKNKAE